MNILLDYAFPISVVESTPAASTAFLKNVCVICKPKSGQEGNVGTITLCTSMSAVSALTDNVDAQQLFNAGMNRVHILLSDELDVSEVFDNPANDFYTLLVSSDYTDADIAATQATGTVTISSYANLIDTGFDTIAVAGVTFTAQAGAATLGTATFRAATNNDATAASLAAQINAHATASALVTASVVNAIVTITANEPGTGGNSIALVYTDNGTATVGASVSGATLTGGDGLLVGEFEGVIGVQTQDLTVAEAQAAIANRVCFFASSTNKAKNMFYAFGSMLSNTADWLNQQYIPMPLNDDVDELGEATNLFDERISFVLNDDEFGNRLALFCAGGKAIVSPYVLKNLRVDLQSKAVQWISSNQPQYTLKNAALLETRLQEDVINSYISRGWIESGSVEITLVNSNFVATGAITVPEPKALWRVTSTMQQTS